MKRFCEVLAIAFCVVMLLFVASRKEYAGPPADKAADTTMSPFTDFSGEQPGKVHHITPADLPAPYATKSSAVFSRPVPRPADAWPQAPAGFKVTLYAEHLKDADQKDVAPRTIITAPNGDFFVAATSQGKVFVFHGMTTDGKPEKMQEFA